MFHAELWYAKNTHALAHMINEWLTASTQVWPTDCHIVQFGFWTFYLLSCVRQVSTSAVCGQVVNSRQHLEFRGIFLSLSINVHTCRHSWYTTSAALVNTAAVHRHIAAAHVGTPSMSPRLLPMTATCIISILRDGYLEKLCSAVSW